MSNHDPIPDDVLRRKAVVYVRQSTQTQVQVNLESKRRQYDLVQKAQGAAAQFDLDATLDNGLHRRGRQGHRDELVRRHRTDRTRFATQFAPPVYDVGVDAVRHRDLGHRGAGCIALAQHQGLEVRAVAPSSRSLVACHRVHVSLTWTRSLSGMRPGMSP